MMRILGIDPGSQITGYGVIDSDGRHSQYIDCGCIRIKADTLADKLGIIFAEVSALIERHNPGEFAIEQVFVSKNAASALKLGQARGAAICAAVNQQCIVSEYSPRSIKQAIVGRGGADKSQVQHMVQCLLNLGNEHLQADAADALAVALCHAHSGTATNQLVQALQNGRARR